MSSETCFSIPKPVYQPAMRIITAITNAAIAQVTTSMAHNYATDLIVRLNIPNGVGMPQINQMFGPIIVTSPTTFLIDINTLFFTPFAIPSSPPNRYTCAQVVPIGNTNDTIYLATVNVLNPFHVGSTIP